jgi:DNA-binding SARP family transcriptional activator
MEFLVLGPLTVAGPDGPVALGGAKQRRVLAVLLLRAGSVVSADALADAVWGERPPPSAGNALQGYVSHLRRALDPSATGRVLVHVPPGYLLTIEPDELDANRFTSLAATGRVQLERGDPATAAATLRSALALWRGPVLADLPDALFAEEAARSLEELRSAALRDRLEADLACGRHEAVLTEIDALAAEQPYDERLLGLQMLALYRSARQSDALAAYARGRRRLVDDLGVEPGPDLRRLQHAILEQDPGLDPVAAGPVVAAPPRRERRLVTVVAADVSRLVAPSGDPETDEVTVQAERDRVRALVRAHGGTVGSPAGLLEVGLFGLPPAHGDDPARAVRCALALRPLPVGVASGEVVTAAGGDGTVEVASGDVVLHRALRLALASTTDVLVDDATRDGGRAAATYAVQPAATAEGAWRAGPRSALVSGAPLTGRASELSAVLSAWERASESNVPQLVTVVGAPGIGKSRLGAEAAAEMRARGARVVVGRCPSHRERSGYAAFGQQVRELAGIAPEDGPAAARRKLETYAASVVAEGSGPVLDHLALLLGLAPEQEVADRLPLFYAARLLVEGAANAQPTVLVYEDAHWADAGTLDLVEHLASRAEAAPLLVLVLARPELVEGRPSWGGVADAVRVTLQPLGTSDGERLATALADGRLSAEDLHRLAQTADGNPLFVEELVAVALEPAGSRAGSRAGPDDRLPTTIQTTIEARLDALPAPAREVLLEAAVMGRQFWPAGLSGGPSLAAAGWDLAAAIDALEARALVRRDARRLLGDLDQYLFKHVLIREVALRMVPAGERRRLHAVTAQLVEQHAGDRRAELAGLLAYHWTGAGEPAKACEYHLLAAEQARRGWAKPEAVASYTAALELLEADPERAGAVRLQRAYVLVENGEYERAAAELDALLPDLHGADLLFALLARTKAAWWLTDADAVRDLAHRVVETAADLGQPGGSAPALALLSHVSGMEGRPLELIARGVEALDGWDPKLLPDERAYHMELVGLARTWVGDYIAAESMLTASYAAANSCHSVEAMIRSGASVALALAGQGRHEDALARIDEVVARGRELELLPRFTARALNMSSMVLREMYALDEADARNVEAEELGRRSAFLLALVQAGIDLLFSDLLRNDLDAARARLPTLWEQTTRAQGFHQWLMTGRLLVAEAELAVAGGRFDDAVARAQTALAHARATSRRKHEAAALRAWGQGLVGAGRPADGVGPLTAALAVCEELAHPPSVWRTAAQLAAAQAAAGRPDDATRAADLARTTAEAFAATLSPTHAEVFRTAPEVAAALASR